MLFIVNKHTINLKALNEARRAFIAENLTPLTFEKRGFLYNLIRATKLVLNYNDMAKRIIWEFLPDEFKLKFKHYKNLKFKLIDFQKFLENVNTELIEYSKKIDYYNSVYGSSSTKIDRNDVECYLAKTYGWTIANIREMGDIDVLNALFNSIKFTTENQLHQIDSIALGTALVQGSKPAQSSYNKIKNSKILKNNPSNNLPNTANSSTNKGITEEQLQRILSQIK